MEFFIISHTHTPTHVCTRPSCVYVPPQIFLLHSLTVSFICACLYKQGRRWEMTRTPPPLPPRLRAHPPAQLLSQVRRSRVLTACPACLCLPHRRPASCPESVLILCLTSLSCMSMNVSAECSNLRVASLGKRRIQNIFICSHFMRRRIRWLRMNSNTTEQKSNIYHM